MMELSNTKSDALLLIAEQVYLKDISIKVEQVAVEQLSRRVCAECRIPDHISCIVDDNCVTR